VRVRPSLQRAIDRGSACGWVRAEEWVHLGRTLPSPVENVRSVSPRVLEQDASARPA